MTYEALRQAVEEAPEDWDRRLVLADLCEELGLAEAACWRWTAGRKKRAFALDRLGHFYWYDGDMSWTEDPSSDLPRELFLLVSGKPHGPFMRGFPTRREADDALLRAWDELYG